MTDVGRTKSAGKAKERVTEERVSMKAKEENLDAKENNTRRGRGKTKNNGEGHENWAECSYSQTISDPEKKEEKRETRGMRWADCEDDEGKKRKKRENKRKRKRQDKRPGKRS